ncbi:MAG TPA: hypothetical protein VI076_15465 [Actinopolymorphaceae bacterium]
MRFAKSALGAGLAGAVLLAVATPALSSGSALSSEGNLPANRIIAQATGSALTVAVAGQKQGSGEYVAEHDGRELHTRGENAPLVPLLDGQRDVVGGALGQDASAGADGRSVACAGVVSRNGSVEVGEHESCLTSRDGRISLSLGVLEQLGLGDVLPELPELPGAPETELPDMELRLEGAAMTARCRATPDAVTGESSPLNAELVAIVDGRRIPILELPASGGSIGLDDILDQLLAADLPPQLAALLKQILAAVPEGGLPTDDLILIRPNEQIRDQGRLTVTALHVAVAPPALVDLTVGRVSCGPNRLRTLPRTPPKPTPKPSPTPDPTAVPTAVPAGLSSMPGGTTGSDARTAPVGWGTGAALLLIGLVVGGLLHRRRG